MTALCASGPARLWRRGGEGNRMLRKAAMSGARLSDPRAMKRLNRMLRLVAIRDQILRGKGGYVA